ncbi:MAG: DUF1501 domain-containing protein [Gemmataceae bacterium]
MTTSRREFLRVGTLALGGLSLPELLAANPSPRTSVILFWMWGGPSQFETFDPKPDAPDGIRGPFRPIHTRVPGMDVCELFPSLAKLADKFSLVRSLHHTMSAHNDGSIEVLTGKTPTRPDPTSTAFSEHPDFGMVADRLRGPRPDGMPQYVGIPRAPFMTRPAYLGVSHQGFATGDPSTPGYAPPQLSLSGGVDMPRLGGRRDLLGRLDAFRRELDGALDGADKLHASALHMLTNAAMARAFDLKREDPRVRDRYGRHLWGQSCLLARRLAEAGAAVVTIDALAPEMGKPIYFSWDDHADAQPGWDLARGMRWRAPFMDQAVSALIDDVYQRGLDRRVMVVAVGEFGRTPRVTRNNGNTGRDHWPDAQCALLAGGGLRTGQVVGATNGKGEYPKERPLTPKDLLATIYHHLGIDPRHEFRDATGRPIPILGEGEPIRELVRAV